MLSMTSRRTVQRRMANALGTNLPMSAVPRPSAVSNPLLRRDWDVAAEVSEPPVWLRPSSSPHRRPAIYFSRDPVNSGNAPKGSVCVPASQLGRAVPLFKITSQTCEYFALRLPLLKGGFKRIADAESPIDSNIMWGKSWPMAQAVRRPPYLKAVQDQHFNDSNTGGTGGTTGGSAQQQQQQQDSAAPPAPSTSASASASAPAAPGGAVDALVNAGAQADHDPAFKRPVHRFQKVNHFSGSHKNLGCKSGMARNLQKLAENIASERNNGNNSKHGEQQQNPIDFIPGTYRLPEDATALRRALSRADQSSTWIVKPSRGSCGRGVRLCKPDDAEVQKLIAMSLDPKPDPAALAAARQQQQRQLANAAGGPGKGGASSTGNSTGTGVAPSTAVSQALAMGRVPMYVVQQYIRNPLLVHGRKFDFRVYVVVTSYDPLVAYIHHSGLVRFAAKKYDASESDINDVYSHLTNYSVGRKLEAEGKEALKRDAAATAAAAAAAAASSTNRKGDDGTSSSSSDLDNDDDDDAAQQQQQQQQQQKKVEYSLELKWSMEKFNAYVKSTFGGQAACDKMWADVEDVITTTLFAVAPQICRSAVNLEGNHDASIELYGFDILLDDKMKPWLIEVNTLPSLESSSAFDYNVKSNVVTDILNLSQLQLYDRAPDVFSAFGLSEIQPPNPSVAAYVHPFDSLYEPAARDATLPQKFATFVGKELAPADDCVDTVARVRDELAVLGGFRLMFPTPERLQRLGGLCYPQLSGTRRCQALWDNVRRDPLTYERACQLKFPEHVDENQNMEDDDDEDEGNDAGANNNSD